MARLYGRIYLHFLGVLFVVGLAASVVFAVGQRTAFERQVTERVSRHIGWLVAEALADPAELGRRLRKLHEDLEINVTVRGLDGRVLGAAGVELGPLTAGEAADLRGGGLVTRPAPVWFVASPVRAAGSGACLLYTSPSPRD